METATVVTNTNVQLGVNYQTSKLLYGDNNHKFSIGDVVASGADVEIVEGMVMARVVADNSLIPADSTVVDGSSYIVGLATKTQTVADGDTVEITIVTGGTVNQNLINFAGSETLTTAFGATGNKKTAFDTLQGLDIYPVGVTDLTDYDN